VQVYERAAIERHLSRGKGAAIDPLSRQPLPSPELTPVYILRSRAAEFREHTAQRNLERACQPGCVDPVRPPSAPAAHNLRGLRRTLTAAGLPVGLFDALRRQPPKCSRPLALAGAGGPVFVRYLACAEAASCRRRTRARRTAVSRAPHHRR